MSSEKDEAIKKAFEYLKNMNVEEFKKLLDEQNESDIKKLLEYGMTQEDIESELNHEI